MKITLLSCGPSVRLYNPQDDDSDIVVAVNRVAQAYPHDYWCFLDKETIMFDAKPSRGIMTTNNIMRHIVDDAVYGKFYNKSWEFIRVRNLYNLEGKTFLFALYTLNEVWNPDEIHVYGHDMSGVEDYTGATEDIRWNNDDNHRRSKQRWDLEGKDWLRLASWYPVYWHRPDGVKYMRDPDAIPERLGR